MRRSVYGSANPPSAGKAYSRAHRTRCTRPRHGHVVLGQRFEAARTRHRDTSPRTSRAPIAVSPRKKLGFLNERQRVLGLHQLLTQNLPHGLESIDKNSAQPVWIITRLMSALERMADTSRTSGDVG